MKTIALDARMHGPEQCTGIGAYIKNLTDNLFKIDPENQYILFLKEPNFTNFTLPNERVKKVLVKANWYTAAEQFKLPFEFLKFKFDLIHFPHFNSPILWPTKSVCTIHDLTPFSFPGHKMKSIFRQIAYRFVFKATTTKAKKIIAVSNYTKLAMIKKFNLPADKIKVIYPGVDEHFSAIADYGIINKIKQKFGLVKPFIFYVGVWRNHKNIESLVKAFNFLKEKLHFDCQLLLGGREDLHYTEVRRLINCSKYKNDIITPGYISDHDLPLLYSCAEVFVLPSFIEGFGLIVIEAQKCGCPVIASQTSSLPEVLADSALYFDPNNIEQIANQIQTLRQNKNIRQNLINKGFYNAKRFNWEQCAKQTLNIYQQCF